MSPPPRPDRPVTGERRDGRSSRWDPHRRERRQAIIAAAVVAIETEGPDALTGQIAQLAGVPRTHVYRHFDGKPALDRAVCSHVSAGLGTVLREAMAVGGSPRAIITSVVGAHLRWLDEHPDLYRFLARHAWAVDTHPDAGSPSDAKAVFADELTALIRRYLRALSVEGGPDPRTVTGIVGLVDSVSAWWLERREPAREEVVAELSEQVWLLLARSAGLLGLALDPDAALPALPVDPEQD